MNENQTQQETNKSFMLIHTALCFYNTKLRKEILSIPFLKETKEDKAILLECTKEPHAKISALITKTFNQITI